MSDTVTATTRSASAGIAPSARGDRPLPEKTRFLSLADELALAKRRVDRANADYRNILKRAKSDGFNTQEMIRSIGERRLDVQTREANKQAYLRYAKWLDEEGR